MLVREESFANYLTAFRPHELLQTLSADNRAGFYPRGHDSSCRVRGNLMAKTPENNDVGCVEAGLKEGPFNVILQHVGHISLSVGYKIIIADNGVVHVIDRVLMPPAQEPALVLRLRGWTQGSAGEANRYWLHGPGYCSGADGTSLKDTQFFDRRRTLRAR